MGFDSKLPFFSKCKNLSGDEQIIVVFPNFKKLL